MKHLVPKLITAATIGLATLWATRCLPLALAFTAATLLGFWIEPDAVRARRQRAAAEAARVAAHNERRELLALGVRPHCKTCRNGCPADGKPLTVPETERWTALLGRYDTETAPEHEYQRREQQP